MFESHLSVFTGLQHDFDSIFKRTHGAFCGQVGNSNGLLFSEEVL